MWCVNGSLLDVLKKSRFAILYASLWNVKLNVLCVRVTVRMKLAGTGTSIRVCRGSRNCWSSRFGTYTRYKCFPCTFDHVILQLMSFSSWNQTLLC